MPANITMNIEVKKNPFVWAVLKGLIWIQVRSTGVYNFLLNRVAKFRIGKGKWRRVNNFEINKREV